MDEDNKVEAQEAEEKKGSWVLSLLGKLIPLLLIVGVSAGLTAYVIMQKPELVGLSKGTKAVQAEVEALINEVGKLIALPMDEKPTVASVNDVEKIKEQPFFKNAKVGDKVLIYTNAKKAILYRPSEKKVVEVGAVAINQQPSLEGTPTPTGKETPTPTKGE